MTEKRKSSKKEIKDKKEINELQTEASPHSEEEIKKDHTYFSLGNIQILLVIIAAILVIANQYNIYAITSSEGVSFLSGGTSGKTLGTSASQQEVIDLLISRGTPKYGAELGVTFEDPVKSLNALALIERKITLDESQKQRYISIESKISCEYCCGAPSVIDNQGRSACGCSHAAAIRGLGIYLLNYHEKEYTDDQISEELGRWKALWFPKQVIQKGLSLQAAGEPVSIFSATSNTVKVQANGKVTKDLSDLPDMVGGC